MEGAAPDFARDWCDPCQLRRLRSGRASCYRKEEGGCSRDCNREASVLCASNPEPRLTRRQVGWLNRAYSSHQLGFDHPHCNTMALYCCTHSM